MTSDEGNAAGAGSLSQRIDKWLWHARIVKTRTLATKLVAAGSMRINKQRIARASHLLRKGDVLTFALGERVKVLRVTGFAERRGPADTARLLYEDISPPPSRPGAPEGIPVVEPGGRPTKKARRAFAQTVRVWPK